MVYGISNEEGADLREMKASHKLGEVFRFLSDTKGVAASKYAGRYENRPVLKPATFVVGRGGRITFAYVEDDHRARPSAEDLVRAVQVANRQIKSIPPARPAAKKKR